MQIYVILIVGFSHWSSNWCQIGKSVPRKLGDPAKTKSDSLSATYVEDKVTNNNHIVN